MNDNWTIEDYDVFIHNLQTTQYYFFNDNNWYNAVIDYILSKPREEAKFLIDLLNDFYCAGKGI